jgi:hypothetical protein
VCRQAGRSSANPKQVDRRMRDSMLQFSANGGKISRDLSGIFPKSGASCSDCNERCRRPGQKSQVCVVREVRAIAFEEIASQS